MKKIEAAYNAFLEEEANGEIVPITVKGLLEDISEEIKTITEGETSEGSK